MTACDSSMYRMLTCTIFDLHSIQCFITHRYWYWDRPILLGIGCPAWYHSNPSFGCCLCGLQEMAAYKSGGKKVAAKAPPKAAAKPVEDDDDDDEEEDDEEEDEESD